MTTFHLVACARTKLSHAAAARDLYRSRWFQLARTIVEQRAERWAILSAKHGLLMPSEVIEPYDETLGTKSRAERKHWATAVSALVPPLVGNERQYAIWGGADYSEHLAPMLDAFLPLANMGIGQQLSYMIKLANPSPPLAEVAREALNLLIRCDDDLCPAGTEPANDFEWDTVRIQLQKSVLEETVYT